MTYRTDCGGQKFFRNKAAECGEDMVRPCFCGGLQNSHAKILGVFGAGMSTIPPPTVQVNAPTAGGTLSEGQIIAFTAGSKRGVEKSELYLNGYKWGEVKGAPFGPNGQPNPSGYSIKLPSGVPDGVIDIQVKAYDDLGIATMSQPVTVTKGQPCTSASTCLAGQKCEAGKCFWEPPTGKLGDPCDYQQFCESNLCVMTDSGEGYCSQDCVVGSMDACPMGFECVAAGTSGACLPVDTGGGCCSVGGADAAWIHGGLSALVLGLVMRRRRRRDRL
jgi:MYXO-CTERM domain-containing protein